MPFTDVCNRVDSGLQIQLQGWLAHCVTMSLLLLLQVTVAQPAVCDGAFWKVQEHL